MTLARVSGSLTRPWGLVQAELDDALGDGQNVDGERHWTVDFRAYSLAVTAERSTGDVELTVSTAFPYTPLAVASLLFAIAITAFGASTSLIALAFSGCLGIAGVALLPGLYHVQMFHHRVPDLIAADTIRLTPSLAFPVGGVLLILWTITTAPLYRGLTLLLAGLLLGITAYAIGAVPARLQRQHSVFVFAAFSSLPLLVTTGNFGLVSYTHDVLPPQHVVLLLWMLCFHTIVFSGAYAFLCRVFAANVDDVSNEPVSSLPSRIGWFGYVLAINVATLLLLGGLLTDGWSFGFLTFPMAELVTAHRVLGVPFPQVTTVAALLLLAMPLLGLLFMWGLHLLRQGRQFGRLKTATTADTSVDSTVPVRILESERPLAYVALLSPGRPVIVLSRGLRDELNTEELAAVIAHEEYHVHNRDPLWNLFASTIGVAIGGRNLLLASHDYPTVEREADRYAADRCGADALVSALRTIERLNMGGIDSHARFDSPSQPGLSWLFTAPYRVLFGSVVVANAHASVDERIERVLTA